MKTPAHVIAFNTTAPPRETLIDDPAVVDTPYKCSSWRCFEAAEKGALSGIWEAGPHLERCTYGYDEMCHILEGKVRLTDAEGLQQTFSPGETFVVAAGFNGTWENLSFVRKVFFIIGPPAEN